MKTISFSEHKRLLILDVLAICEIEAIINNDIAHLQDIRYVQHLIRHAKDKDNV